MRCSSSSSKHETRNSISQAISHNILEIYHSFAKRTRYSSVPKDFLDRLRCWLKVCVFNSNFKRKIWKESRFQFVFYTDFQLNGQNKNTTQTPAEIKIVTFYKLFEDCRALWQFEYCYVVLMETKVFRLFQFSICCSCSRKQKHNNSTVCFVENRQ